MRKIVSVWLVVLLVFSFSSYAGAVENQSQSLSKNASSAEGVVKKQERTSMKENEIPSEYSLIENEKYIGTLLDDYSTTQTVSFEGINANYSADEMDVKVNIKTNEPTHKARYVDIEFYKEQNGELVFESYTRFDTYGYTDSSIGSILPKTTFQSQPYLYIRIGIYNDINDVYFSDVLRFKVKNPSYSSTSSSNDGYVVISNESTSEAGYTGDFSVKNTNVLKNSGLKQSAYKMNVKRPFDVVKNKNRMLKANMSSPKLSEKVNDVRDFYAYNFETDGTDIVTATLLYSGSNANVWAPAGVLTTQEATQIGQEFDNKIHPVIAGNFGLPSDIDNNGKVNILTYDIQDGFYRAGSYIAGYFYGGDLFDGPDSNKSEIFYVDTYPTMGMDGTKNVAESFSTLAHEYQHMVNFNQNVLKESSQQDMDVWLDEGLAMAAEQIYLGKALTDRIDYYNASYSIRNGHSLLKWGENGDVLSNYSLSYLFGQYLRVQTKQGNKIFKEIIESPNNDYVAVEKAIQKYIDPNMTFGQFMTSFRSALLLKESSGLNGFMGETAFNTIKTPLYTGTGLSLSGGGAVVKEVDTTAFKVPTDKDNMVTYSLFGTSIETPTVNAVGDSDTKVTGKASVNSTVYVKVGTTVIGSGQTLSDKTFSITIPKQKVGTTLKIYAKNNFTGQLSSETSIVVSDKTAPSITLKASTIELTNSDVTITATATDNNGVKRIKLPNGTYVTGSTATYKVSKNGTYMFEAEDNAGNVKTESIVVNNIDKEAPTLTLKASTTGLTKNDVTITVTASDSNGVKRIKLPNGTYVTTSTTTYKVSKNGTYTFAAEDNVGNVKTQSIVVKNIDKTAPPKPTVNLVHDKDTVVTGTAEPNATVYVKVGTSVKGSAKADAKGNYSVKIAAQKGDTILTVYAKDAAGNMSAVQTTKVINTAAINFKVTKVTDMKKFDGGKNHLTFINGKGYSQFFYQNNSGNYQFIPSSWLKAAGLTVEVKNVNGKKLLYINNPYKQSTVSVVRNQVTMPYASVQVKVTSVTDMKKYDAGKGKYLTYVNGRPYSQFFYENNSGNYQFVPSSWLKAAGLTVEVKTVGGVKKLYINNPYKK